MNTVAQGAALDIIGGHGAGTAGGVIKGTYEGIKQHFNKEKVKNTIEGTADLLSRQAQHGRTTALDFLNRINKISGGNKSKLAVDYSGLSGLTVPATIPAIKTGKRKLSDLVGISEQ